MRFSLLFLLLLVFLGGFAQKYDLSDFRLSGDAYRKGDDCFSLVPDAQWAAGSIWYKDPIDLKQPFEIELDVMLGCNDKGADGVVIVFATDYRHTGYRGEGMGFGGLFPSLGIEMDTYYNRHRGDPEGDHLALLSQGDVSHRFDLAGPKVVANLEDCRNHNLLIKWDAKINRMTILLDQREILRYTGDLVEKIFFGNSKLYWGITAGTGRYHNRHEFCIEKMIYSNPDEEEEIAFLPTLERKLLKSEMISMENIQFPSGSMELTPATVKELDKLVQLLESHPDHHISIYGHTDSGGSAATNQQLSENRAARIKEYLERKGINTKRIHAIGLGEKYPVTTNSTAEGRQKNRRIDVMVYKPQV